MPIQGVMLVIPGSRGRKTVDATGVLIVRPPAAPIIDGAPFLACATTHEQESKTRLIIAVKIEGRLFVDPDDRSELISAHLLILKPTFGNVLVVSGKTPATRSPCLYVVDYLGM